MSGRQDQPEARPGAALLMFAKAPVPGAVKTRLAADLGDDVAARLQAAFLADLTRRFARTGARRVLACAPDTEHPSFEAAAALGWERVPQGEGDLGQRLTRSFAALCEAGADRVVCIGSDSPSLPEALVAQAFAALEAGRSQAVVAPGFDGGYVLVGARRPLSPLFAGIPWGTEHVFATTVRQLEAAAVPFEVLSFWYDVDDLRSLRGLANHLGARGPYGPIEAPETARLLAELGLVERGTRDGDG